MIQVVTVCGPGDVELKCSFLHSFKNLATAHGKVAAVFTTKKLEVVEHLIAFVASKVSSLLADQSALWLVAEMESSPCA